MNKKMKFWLTAGLITVVTGTSTAAMAAGNVTTFIKKAVAPATATEGKTGMAKPFIQGKDHMIAGGHKGIAIFNQDLFKLLNLTQDQFRTQTESGKTLVEIGKAQGVTEQQLIDFFTKQNTTQLDTAVKDGKLTQEQADKIKADFPTHIKEMINNPLPTGPGGKFGKGDFGHGMVIGLKLGSDELLKLLNLTEEQFKTELQSGKTLLDIAKAHNVTEQQLTDFLVKENTTRLDAAVKDGKLTQEQADKMKADFPTHVKEMINNTAPAGGHGPDKFGGPGMFLNKTDNAALLKLLNITEAQFQTELQSGKTLLDIAKAHNITEQQLTDLLVSQRTADIDQAVKDGKMTQSQADQCKANLAEMTKNMINSTPGEHGFHGEGKGNFKGMGKGKHFNGQTAPNATQPNAGQSATQPTQQSFRL